MQKARRKKVVRVEPPGKTVKELIAEFEAAYYRNLKRVIPVPIPRTIGELRSLSLPIEAE